jgi:hypothetical protein
VEQRFVEEYFGVSHSVLRKAWKHSATGEAVVSPRWSTCRKGLARRHFDRLRRLFGLETELALDALHQAVTTEATGAVCESAMAGRLLEKIKSPKANVEEVKALARQYLEEHPGMPLGPLSAVTGLTRRILSNLRPPHEGSSCDWWKEAFKQSEDYRIWSTLRLKAGLPLNGWRRSTITFADRGD